MRITSLLPLLAAFGVLAAPGRAERAWRQARLEMSDGQTIQGEVYVTQDRLSIYNDAHKRYVTIPVAQIKQVETILENETMERKWIFLEDGRDEKFYTDETYPVRSFKTRLTLHDGSTLTGHVTSRRVLVRSESGTVRLMLSRKLEGNVGQEPAALVYIETLTFLGEGREGTIGTISGRVRLPTGERLLAVKAIHLDHDFVAQASLSEGGKFAFAGCTAGAYDLVVVTDKSIYVYFSRENDEGAARLHTRVLEEIRRWAAAVRDFFHVQDPVYGAGNGERAYVLVRKERHGGMTAADGAKLIRRYDVWLLHKPREQWQIKKRFYISRKQTADARDPRERIVVSPQLGGHSVTAEHKDLTLSLELGPNKEMPAPPPPPPTKEAQDNGE